MADKTEAIRMLAKQKSETREKEVLRTIRKMKKAGTNITFYSVAKTTGASKSYLYNNENIAACIRKYRSDKKSRTPESNDVIIKSLKLRITQLEAENQKLQAGNSESWRSRCEKLQEENRRLKEQLEVAYKY